MIESLVLIIFAYLLGSIPFGYVLGKITGVDVRNVGSGNIGATNVARTLGKWRGALTLLADTAKGFIPVYLARQLGVSHAALAATSVAAFLGHLYPLFLRFQGGKGVATALGTLLALAPVATAVLMVIFSIVVFLSRIVSLGAVVTAAATPLVLWLFYQPPEIVAMGLFFAAMVVLRHRGNIQRLLAGTESRFTLR